ncbi:MAG: SGNH/GDSL hydrolase family protein [Janthinobacterium lividum]
MSSIANHPDSTRRGFLKKASAASLLAIGSPESLFAPESTSRASKITLAPNDIILFQGDSITDAGRKKDPQDADVPNTTATLGNGYAYLSAAALLQRHADKKPVIYNRGISGNKVYQLTERWDKDCLDLKPNVLSILIGVNDFWHTLTGNYQGTVKTYTDDYKALLDRTRQRLPNVKLIIGEPFAVIGVKAVDEKWYPAFKDYQAAARSLAAQYHATLIPYQSIFDQAQKRAPGAYWTGDGVHPSVAGNQLMAQAWLDTFKR